MPNENEDIDSTIDEEGVEEVETNEVDTEVDTDALEEKNRQLFERAKKAEEKLKALKSQKPKTAKSDNQISDDDLESRIEAKFAKREIDALGVSDNIKEEIQNYSQMKNVSIQKALDSDYIKFLKNEDDVKQKNEEASLGGKSKATSITDFSNVKSSDFDLSTKEGQDDFEKYEEHLKKQLG